MVLGAWPEGWQVTGEGVRFDALRQFFFGADGWEADGPLVGEYR